MSLSAGARLGPYEILGPIGAGGMGVVYQARDTRLQRTVALKLLTAQLNPHALMREARAAAALNHPSICTVHEVGESDGVAFIAMELVEGESLERVIRRGPLDADRVCRIGRQLAEALEHAHAHGVIHRDLKSANVVVTPAGRAKILDFGIAERQPVPGAETQTFTMGAGSVVAGTLAYMAPEALRGGGATAQGDIWALGVVLYEMTSGRLPFQGDAHSDLVAAILRDAPAPLRSGTPPALARIVMKCLAKEPGERPGRAGEVALALEVADPGAINSQVEPGPPRVGGRWRTPPLLASGLLVLAALMGATYWAYVGRGTEAQPFRLTNPTQITTDVGVEEYADWSPDGRTLAYAASPSGNSANDESDIWVTQGVGANPINRTEGRVGQDLFPSWSPDGKQIAFWSAEAGGGCYVMPAIAGPARKVFATGLLDPNPPQWSADGTALGCVVTASPADVALHLISLVTGQSLQSYRLPGEGRRNFVRLTHDQRAIALIASSGGLSSDLTQLWVFDTSRKAAHALTDGLSKVVSPSWSADGRTLYYVKHSGATMDLWQQAVNERLEPQGPPIAVTAGLGIRNASLSPDGRKLVYSQGRRIANAWRLPILADRTAEWADAERLTSDQAFIECTDVSRDGTRLVISSDRSGSFDLWSLPADGGELQRLTTDPSAEWCPRWSPDMTTLVFYAYRTGNRDIWTMPAAGGAWTQVTSNPGTDMLPSWSPDGKEVVYLATGVGGAGTWVSPASGGQPRRVLASTNAGPSWSPADRRIAVSVLGERKLWIVDPDGTAPPRLLLDRETFTPKWAPSGRTLYFILPGSEQQVLAVNDDGSGERVVATLSGRRGSLGSNGLSTDGRHLYFTWEEDLGDLWTMDVQISR